MSVVIPLYNKAKYIKRALDSVLAQSYQDFEVIVVNDGSTDGSEKVVEQYTDPRVRLISQQNAGASAARNRGIVEAKYELVAFLDADDEWHPDYLVTIMQLRAEYPGAAAWGTLYEYMEADGSHGTSSGGVVLRERRKDSGVLNYFAGRRAFHICSICALKGVLLNIGLFTEGLVRGEDEEVFIKIAMRHDIAIYLQPKAVYHREAYGRTDVEDCLWVGVPPHFQNLVAFLGGMDGPPKERREAMIDHVMFRHQEALISNVLAGHRAEAKRILADFRRIGRYGRRQAIWHLLSWMPQTLVARLWVLYARRLYGSEKRIGVIRYLYPPALRSKMIV